MTNAFPKLLTAATAAVLISIGSVSAQTDDNPKASRDFVQDRMTPDLQVQMRDTFRGMGAPAASSDVTFAGTPGSTVPEGWQTQPVPAEVIEVFPEAEGYHYVTLADGRTALVHPIDRDIVVVFE